MASLNMGTKRYPLNRVVINGSVEKKAGNYALGIIEKQRRKDPITKKQKTYNKFIVKYVGRSDNNLQKEIIQQGVDKKVDENGRQLYSHFAFTHKRKLPKTAFLMECKNFHDFGGAQKLDNERHPKRPTRFNKKTLPCSKKTCKN